MEQSIINRLDRIEKVLELIQENINDIVLTGEELKMLDESLEHEKERKLVSLEAIKNVRNKAG